MLATGLKRFWRKPPNPWGSARLPKYRQPVLLFHIVLALNTGKEALSVSFFRE
jgi:hypothetical protein